MGHKNKGNTCFSLKPLQLKLHLLTQLEIQRTQRLVEQQNLGLWRQRPRKRNALLLPARDLPGLAVRHLSHFDELHHLFDCRLNLSLRPAKHFKPKANILGNRQMWKKRITLKHSIHGPLVRRQIQQILAKHIKRPGGRMFKSSNQAQKRGLAAARWPQKREKLVILDLKARISQSHNRRLARIHFTQVSHANGCAQVQISQSACCCRTTSFRCKTRRSFFKPTPNTSSCNTPIGVFFTQ